MCTLKSSLDRFIVMVGVWNSERKDSLKSSLDRFIVISYKKTGGKNPPLKSSLDRFIVVAVDCETTGLKVFKIQFG